MLAGSRYRDESTPRTAASLRPGCRFRKLLGSRPELNFDLLPEVVVDVRLDEEARQRAELELDDFTLRPQVYRLFAQIDTLKNGTVEKIVVYAGLPCRVTLRRSLSQKPQ